MRIKYPSLDWYFKWRRWTWCIYNAPVWHELFLHCWSSAETQNCWVPLDHESSASITASAASSSAPPEISYASFSYGPGDSRLTSWLVRSFLLYFTARAIIEYSTRSHFIVDYRTTSLQPNTLIVRKCSYNKVKGILFLSRLFLASFLSSLWIKGEDGFIFIANRSFVGVFGRFFQHFICFISQNIWLNYSYW